MKTLTFTSYPKTFRQQVLSALMANIAEGNCENFCDEIVQNLETELAAIYNFDDKRIFLFSAIKQIKEAMLISRYNFNHQKPQVQIRMGEMLQKLTICIEKKFQYLIQPNLLTSLV
jgi:hypothetical protein